MTPAELAAAAAFERDERERLYPGLVRSGKVSAEEAEADWQAWIAIARILAGRPAGFDISLATCELATSRALIRRDAACRKHPADESLRRRSEAVFHIHRAITRQRSLVDAFNAAFRARAERMEV